MSVKKNIIKIFKKKRVLILILIFAGFLRLANLNGIPIFADEAISIYWAQQAWHNSSQRFISLTDGKPPLHTWLMILFLKIVKDPLIAGRLLSVSAGLATLTGIFFLTKKIFSKRLTIIAGLLTAICPFLVFYDRLAVADSLLTAFGVWSFYFGLLFLEESNLINAFLVGLCWGGGLLTKQPAFYFILLFPSLIFLTRWRFVNQKRKKILFNLIFKRLKFIFFSLTIAFLSYNIVKFSPHYPLLSTRTYDYILGKKEFLQDPFILIWGNLKGIISWLYSYQRFIPTVLFLMGVILMFRKEWLKAIVFLFWLVIPILGSAAVGKIIFPRYFLFTQPWLIIFTAYGIENFYLWLSKKLKKAYFLTGIFFFSWLIFSLLIVFRPVKAPLAEREQNQYLTSWSSGWGIKQIAEYLKKNHQSQKVYVATEGYFGTLPNGLLVYLDGFDNFTVYGIGQPISEIPQKTLERAKTSPTYLIVNNTRYLGNGENLKLIKEFPKPEFPFLKESLLFFKVENEN